VTHSRFAGYCPTFPEALALALAVPLGMAELPAQAAMSLEAVAALLAALGSNVLLARRLFVRVLLMVLLPELGVPLSASFF
jgi:hypothetical protein